MFGVNALSSFSSIVGWLRFEMAECSEMISEMIKNPSCQVVSLCTHTNPKADAQAGNNVHPVKLYCNELVEVKLFLVSLYHDTNHKRECLHRSGSC